MPSKKVAIVGAGHTPFGRLEDNLEDLITRAAREAIADAEIDIREIDAVFLGHFNAGMVTDGFASSLIHQTDDDLRFKPAVRVENACASGAAAIFSAINAIAAGNAKTVLVVGAEKMTHNDTATVTAALGHAGYQHNDEASLSFPQVFSGVADAYDKRYGNPLHAMAQIAVKNHANAMKNPLAQMPKPFTIDMCDTVSDKNPLIAPPLRLTDCSLISDGAAALVLTDVAQATAFPRVAYFRAAAQVSDYLPMARRDVLAFEGPKKAVQQAYQQANLSVDDMNFAEVHDCFTIAELLMYEALGLCENGQGAKVIDDGSVFRDGRLPVNVSGGLKAKGHPVGATGVSMHALAYRQLTGQGGEMQLPCADNGLILNMGGAAVANYVSILSQTRGAV